jgi:hypothetical protein
LKRGCGGCTGHFPSVKGGRVRSYGIEEINECLTLTQILIENGA